MIRRDFLKLLSGAILASQLPAIPAIAEEKTGDYSVRFLQAYDVLNDQVIQRVDVSKGVELALPRGVDMAARIDGVDREFISQAIRALRNANVPDAAITQLEDRYADMKTGDIIGVSYPKAR